MPRFSVFGNRHLEEVYPHATVSGALIGGAPGFFITTEPRPLQVLHRSLRGDTAMKLPGSCLILIGRQGSAAPNERTARNRIRGACWAGWTLPSWRRPGRVGAGVAPSGKAGIRFRGRPSRIPLGAGS